MLLKLYSVDSFRTINLNPQFFDNSTVKVGKGFKTITSSEKAEEMGMDIYGRNYRGHILEQDGEIISNTLENRGPKNPLSGEVRHKLGSIPRGVAPGIRLAKLISKGLK